MNILTPTIIVATFVDSLTPFINKTVNIKTIAIAGGVASNSSLRETLIKEASKRGIEVLFPAPILCTDNAAMIGSAAYFNFVNGKISDLNLNAKPNLKLNS